jgi:WD40 repeat protein
VAFSPDGRMLASGSRDSDVILWDPQTGQQIGEPLGGHDDWVNSVAFSLDGRMLTSGSSDNNVILWDPQTGQQIGEPLRGHDVLGDVGVGSVAFSPNVRVLASGSGDNIVILWDVDIESWKERACRTANRNLTQSEWTQYLGNEPYHKTCSNAPEGG